MEHMIKVGADEVWSDENGSAAGLPLVLLHPGIGVSSIWDPVLPDLAQDRRVIRYDTRGYGRSPLATESYVHRHDLTTVLDHYGIEKAHLAGNSMGGGTALSLAVLEPDRVASATLLMPGVSGYDWPDAPSDEKEERMLGEGDVDGLVELMLTIWCADGRGPEVVEQVRAASKAFLNEREFQDRDEPVWDRLGEIKIPTSVMVGGLDHPAMAEANQRMGERIPGCQVVQMPAVDHLPTLRVPQVVVETIQDTIARAEG